MLWIDRKKHQKIVIETPGGPVTVEVCRMGTEKVSLGVTSPASTSITRPDMVKAIDPKRRLPE